MKKKEKTAVKFDRICASNLLSTDGKKETLVETNRSDLIGLELLVNPAFSRSDKKQHGLLGMNFLEKHQFTIDSRRQIVMWR